MIAAAEEQVLTLRNDKAMLFTLGFDCSLSWVCKLLSTEIVWNDKRVQISLDAVGDELRI